MSKRSGTCGSERGIALIAVLLLALIVTVIAISATLIGGNASLIRRYSERLGRLEAAADAGIEEARSRINGTRALYPDSHYVALERNASVADANGNVIPGVTRSTYVGPTGVTSGQYGVFGSIVVVAQDATGNTVVRRGEVAQESFAKYAYFTDVEPANISFGGGDQIFGPVHTNSYLKIYSSGATFHGPTSTALTIQGRQYGTFVQGYTENAPYVAMPQTADLNRLAGQASAGGTRFTSTMTGTAGQATTRIEFIAIDLDADGSVTGSNEGFIRVYQSGNPSWVVGGRPSDYTSNRLRNSVNCGHYHGSTFVNAALHPTSGPDSYVAALSNAGKRCYLGGSDSLWGRFVASDGSGQWLRWNGPVSPLLASRADRDYLFPITRGLNASFKGVIYVDGNVAVSGVVRGQVTLAATGRIVIADDVTYATDPGVADCTPAKDILGLFSATDIVVADNTVNAPTIPAGGANYFTYDDTKDEFVHAVLLALNIFTVENYATGASRAEACETRLWGRGCLYLTGGIIQRQRGAVGTILTGGGTGYVKRYSHDGCAFQYPPPYFPTTGHFARGRYSEVDPTNFDVATYFRLLTAQ